MLMPVETVIHNKKGTTDIEITASSFFPVEFWLKEHLKLIDHARSCGGSLISEQPKTQLPPNAVWCVIHFNSMSEMMQFMEWMRNR